jgi:hypothetical protein
VIKKKKKKKKKTELPSPSPLLNERSLLQNDLISTGIPEFNKQQGLN